MLLGAIRGQQPGNVNLL